MFYYRKVHKNKKNNVPDCFTDIISYFHEEIPFLNYEIIPYSVISIQTHAYCFTLHNRSHPQPPRRWQDPLTKRRKPLAKRFV